jgi:hypothetical protein
MMRSWPVLQTVVLLVLSVACLAMAGLVYAELTWPVAAAEDVSAASPPASASTPRDDVGTKFSLPPVESFAAVTDRPLFAQSRRPPAQGSDDSLGPWSGLVLAGVVISPTGRQALILHGKPQTTAHVAEGQNVDGWVVTSILPDRIVIRGGTSEHELRLLEKAPATPTSPPGIPSRRSFNNP